MSDPFSMPFRNEGVLDQALSPDAPFIVAAMVSAGYPYAKRLAASCRALGVSFVIHEVLHVHRSIAPDGTEDPSYTKSSFIRFLLEEHRRPILYLDGDCVLRSYPSLIAELARGPVDFAIYNWLADECTDAFVPVDVLGPSGEMDSKRFYGFSHAIDLFDPSQLICSGAAQFYNDTSGARLLLAEWQNAIQRFPGSADDQCLNLAFNNLASDSGVRAHWLPKDYARYLWWIYIRPIIDHPQVPAPGGRFVEIPDTNGQRRFYPERTQRRQPVCPLPRDCIVDTVARMLLRPVDGQLVLVGPTDREFWLNDSRE
jgi:hypothetical protein